MYQTGAHPLLLHNSPNGRRNPVNRFDLIARELVTTRPTLPACQRCGHEDKRGPLANLRGVMVCGLCLGIAKARHRLGRAR